MKHAEVSGQDAGEHHWVIAPVDLAEPLEPELIALDAELVDLEGLLHQICSDNNIQVDALAGVHRDMSEGGSTGKYSNGCASSRVQNVLPLTRVHFFTSSLMLCDQEALKSCMCVIH